MPIAALSKLDLDAAALAQRWGVDLTRKTVLRPASPCQRRHCGGSVLALGGINCLLCARPHGRNNRADEERELARETGLAGLAKTVLGQ